jgi:hypothetical protein
VGALLTEVAQVWRPKLCTLAVAVQRPLTLDI